MYDFMGTSWDKHLERKRCALTIDVESDIHEINFSDVDEIYYLLDLFQDLQISCTFFVTGRFFEKVPSVVNSVTKRGHEIAFHGYAHECWKGDTKAKINDLKKLSKLTQSLGISPLGFRAPFLSITDSMLEYLRKIGFVYDSSMFQKSVPKPIHLLRPYLYDQPFKRNNRFLVEFPISTTPIFRFPYSLNWLLLMRSSFYKLFTEIYMDRILVFYMHPYDLLPQSQRFGMPISTRFLGQKDSKKVLNSFLQHLLDRNYEFVRLMDELSSRLPSSFLDTNL